MNPTEKTCICPPSVVQRRSGASDYHAAGCPLRKLTRADRRRALVCLAISVRRR